MNQEEKQLVFNTVVTALLKQGGPSSADDMCLYRGPKGVKCAIGHIMPDELYRSDMEGKDISNFIPFEAVCGTELIEVTRDDSHFLQRLQQRLHDDLGEHDFVNKLKSAAREFADIFRLNLPPCMLKQVGQ